MWGVNAELTSRLHVGTCRASGVGLDSGVSPWVSSVPCIDWDWILPAGSCDMRGPPGWPPSQPPGASRGQAGHWRLREKEATGWERETTTRLTLDDVKSRVMYVLCSLEPLKGTMERIDSILLTRQELEPFKLSRLYPGPVQVLTLI